MLDNLTIVYSPGARVGEKPIEATDGIIASLAASDVAFEVVPDICELVARRDPAIRRWAAATDLRVAGLPKRAVKWLFHAAGQTLPETATVLDTAATPLDEVAEQLLAGDRDAGNGDRKCCPPDAGQPDEAITVVLYEGPGAKAMTPPRRAEILAAAVTAGYRAIRPAAGATGHADTAATAIVGDFEAGQIPADLADRRGTVCVDASGKCACGTIGAVSEARAAMGLPEPGQWVPWFPVVDYDRCVGCLQCANFCLFSVYSTDGGLGVSNPAGCKTNCPACARMCPQTAIIFPYYPTGPINGRDATDQSADQVSLKEALKGDVYQVLRNRGKAGDAVAATPAGAKPSLADLARIAEKVEIPPEVLMSLGSASAPDGACNCDCGCDADADCGGSADAGCGCDANAGCGCKAEHSEPDAPGCDCSCDCGQDEGRQASGD